MSRCCGDDRLKKGFNTSVFSTSYFLPASPYMFRIFHATAALVALGSSAMRNDNYEINQYKLFSLSSRKRKLLSKWISLTYVYLQFSPIDENPIRSRWVWWNENYMVMMMAYISSYWVLLKWLIWLHLSFGWWFCSFLLNSNSLISPLSFVSVPASSMMPRNL